MTTSIETEVVRYLDHLTVERGLSEHTIAAYRRDLARYTRFLASRDVVDPAKVDEALVRSFLASLSASTHGDERPYRATSVARALSSVRSFHRFLVREGVTNRDPAVGWPSRSCRARCRIRSPSTRWIDCWRLQIRRPRRAGATARSSSSCTARACASPSSRGSTSTTWTSRRACAGARQGREGARCPCRTLRPGCGAGLSHDGPSGVRIRPGAGALFLNQRGGRLSRQSCDRMVRAAAVRPASIATSRCTPCATRSRRTCSRAAPMCASCRNCSGMRAWPPRRSTRWSPGSTCVRSTTSHPRARRPPAGAGARSTGATGHGQEAHDG